MNKKALIAASIVTLAAIIVLGWTGVLHANDEDIASSVSEVWGESSQWGSINTCLLYTSGIFLPLAFHIRNTICNLHRDFRHQIILLDFLHIPLGKLNRYIGQEKRRCV